MEQPALTAVSSSVPLRPVRGFRGCVRRCVETLRRVPREELSVAGRWIEDHAPLLMQEAFAFLSPAPRLPGPTVRAAQPDDLTSCRERGPRAA